MSILEVKILVTDLVTVLFLKMSHSVCSKVSISRCLGANGEGKSTFMSIVTGKLQPDEGKVEWSKYVTAGYLDQHAVLEKE